MELVRVHDDLVEGSVTESECAAFLDPRCSGFGGRDVDLMLTAGSDLGAEVTHNVFLGQHIDQAAIVFLGYEVAALCIHAFGKHIADLAEVGA